MYFPLVSYYKIAPKVKLHSFHNFFFFLIIVLLFFRNASIQKKEASIMSFGEAQDL